MIARLVLPSLLARRMEVVAHLAARQAKMDRKKEGQTDADRSHVVVVAVDRYVTESRAKRRRATPAIPVLAPSFKAGRVSDYRTFWRFGARLAVFALLAVRWPRFGV